MPSASRPEDAVRIGRSGRVVSRRSAFSQASCASPSEAIVPALKFRVLVRPTKWTPFLSKLYQARPLPIDIYLSGARGARGCFLISTAAAESVHDRRVRASFAAGLHELDDQLEARIRRALAEGAFKPTSRRASSRGSPAV